MTESYSLADSLNLLFHLCLPNALQLKHPALCCLSTSSGLVLPAWQRCMILWGEHGQLGQIPYNAAAQLDVLSCENYLLLFKVPCQTQHAPRWSRPRRSGRLQLYVWLQVSCSIID